MAKAIWHDTVIADSDTFEMVEGNVYFPIEKVNKEFLKPSSTHTTCPWKGVASYYNLEIKGSVNKDAVWYYPEPSEKAKNIKDHVAFWKGVKVIKD